MAHAANSILEKRTDNEHSIPTYGIVAMIIGGVLVGCMLTLLGRWCYGKRTAYLEQKHSERHTVDPELGQGPQDIPIPSLEADTAKTNSTDSGSTSATGDLGEDTVGVEAYFGFDPCAWPQQFCFKPQENPANVAEVRD